MSSGFEETLRKLGVKSSPPTETEQAQKHYQTDRTEILQKLLSLERLAPQDSTALEARGLLESADKLAEKKQYGTAQTALKKKETLSKLDTAIKLADKAFKKNIEQTNERRKDEFKQLENKQLFLAELESAEKAERELAGLPMATAEHRALQDMIEKARDAERRGDYVVGRTHFKKVNETLTLGKRKQSQAIEQAKQQFAGIFRNRAELEQALRASSTMPVAERDTLLLRLDQVVQPTLGKTYEKILYEKVLDDLDDLQEEVRLRLTVADDAEKSAREALAVCQQALEETSGMMTVRDCASLEREQRTLQAWYEQREFQQVVDAQSEFVAEAKRLREEVADAKRAWEQSQGELQELIKTCADWARGASPALRDFSPTPAELEGQFAALSKQPVGSHVPYTAAVQRFQDLGENVAAIRARLKSYEEFASARDEAAQRVQVELNAARQAVGKLLERAASTVRRSEGNPLETAGDYGVQLEDLTNRWKSLVSTALTVGDLDEAAIVGEAQKLTIKVNGITDPGDFMWLLGQEKHAEARRQFAKLLPPIREDLDLLRPFASPRYAELGKQLALLTDREADSKDQRTVENLALQVQELRNEIQTEIYLMSRDSNPLRMELQELHVGVGKKLDAFDQMIERYDQSFLTKNSQYKEYAKTLRLEWLGQSHVFEERDRDVLQAGRTELLLLDQRVLAALNGLQRGATSQDEPVLENVVKELTRSRRLLQGNEALTLYMAAERGALDQRLKDIDGEKTTRPFDESLKLLAAWNERYLSAARQAAVAAREYGELEQQIKAARELLKKNQKAFEPFQNYVKRLEERIEKIARDGKSAAGVKAAGVDLQTLVVEINSAVERPDAMREGSELAIAADQKRNDEAHEWKGLVKRFTDKTLSDLKRAGVKSDLYQEVVKLGDIAQDTFKRSQDFEMAKLQIDLAFRRAQDALAYPQGVNSFVRAELPKATRQWAEAVRGLRTALDELADEIRKSDVEGKQSDAIGAAERELQKVRDLYLEGAFAKVAEHLSLEGLDESEIRASREEGLRIVRRYQACVLKDSRTQLVYGNPFVKPFRALNTLNHSLLNLEHNLLLIQ